MAIENAPTETGKQGGRGLHKATRAEERNRFEERSKSSDGKSAGEKQRS